MFCLKSRIQIYVSSSVLVTYTKTRAAMIDPLPKIAASIVNTS